MVQPWVQNGSHLCQIIITKVETKILNQSALKPLIWKRYIDDIFSLWTLNREGILQFIEQVNKHCPTIKFMAEISETETTFLDSNIYKIKRFRSNSSLDVPTAMHFKRTKSSGIKHSFEYLSSYQVNSASMATRG